MIHGYARVSTDGQSVDAQVKQLRDAGAENIFREAASGANADRRELARALRELGAGDTLLVTRLDRLARSTRDLKAGFWSIDARIQAASLTLAVVVCEDHLARIGIAEAEMNEKAKDAAQSAADDRDYARLEKDLTAVKNDIAHLSQQISEAVNALGAVAQGQARRGLRHARANVDSVMSDASDRAGAVANAAQDAVSSVGDTLADVIQERPVATLAFALGLGFLIGVTWRPRDRRRPSHIVAAR